MDSRASTITGSDIKRMVTPYLGLIVLSIVWDWLLSQSTKFRFAAPVFVEVGCQYFTSQ
ncbi:MAG: hypothetical protein JRN20_04275 [Nitrososphaerota archaeon]|nr:hypothetical protein [Nitrososphaerota archaeon]